MILLLDHDDSFVYTLAACVAELGGQPKVIRARIPILGVCLEHHCVAAAFGAAVERTPHPRHGRASAMSHDGRSVFTGVPSPCRATRYHSLAVVVSNVPAMLEVTAIAEDGDIMGVRHRVHPIEGVQFHPESVLTEWGHRMLANFLGG